MNLVGPLSVEKPMSFVYFKKELVSNILKANGTPVAFEVLGGNTGVIKLNTETSSPLIAELRKVAGTRGVVEISEAIYESLKKNRPYSPSVRNSPNGTPQLQVLRRDLGPKKPEAASPVVAAAPAPEPAKPQPKPKNDASVAPEPPAKRPPAKRPPANIGVPKAQPVPA